jgi:hemerythrin-like domain-containing protein
MARPDPSVYLLTHNGIRQEFALLSRAAKSVRNDKHRELIENQIAICTEVLRLHHNEEDSWLFPTLVSRLPDSEPGISALVEDHHELDALIAEVSDLSRSLEERGSPLNDLHSLINELTTREERDVIPLVQRAISAAEWDESVHRPLNAISRDHLPLVFGWLASANEPEEMKHGLNSMPVLVRVMFKLSWAPAYQKRYAELYG